MNPYRNRTTFTSRPARNDPRWRYVDEGELVRNQDLWDEAETTRRWIESEQKVIDQRMAANAEAEERAKKSGKTRRLMLNCNAAISPVVEPWSRSSSTVKKSGLSLRLQWRLVRRNQSWAALTS